MANGSSAPVLNPQSVSQQQQFIFDQFNGTTYMPNQMDVQHEPIYDQLTTPQAGTIVNLTQFFTNPAGKTVNQTNVFTPKKLDAPEAFAVMAIRWFPSPDVLLADLIAVMNNFVLEFWIGNKWYNRGPLWHYNAGGGIAGDPAPAAGATTPTIAWTNGNPGRPMMHELAINIVIDNQASFFGQLNGVATVLTGTAAGGTGLTQMMLLDGLHARGVQ